MKTQTIISSLRKAEVEKRKSQLRSGWLASLTSQTDKLPETAEKLPEEIRVGTPSLEATKTKKKQRYKPKESVPN